MEQQAVPVKKRRESIAIYAKIALDIANRIASGEIPEGKRLSGRSLMSSEYGVSPETIRRACSLLEEMHVVEVYQNSGVLVRSRSHAIAYIEKHGDRDQIRTQLSRMRDLIDTHAQIERELFAITRSLIDSTERFAASNPFYTYECAVPENSPLIGKGLGDLQFWQETGATVIAIRREGSIILSPGPKLPIEPLDVLVLVGNEHTKPLVEQLIG